MIDDRTVETIRQIIAERIGSDPFAYVQPSDVADASDVSPQQAGQYLARMADDHTSMPAIECPGFEVAVYRRSNTRAVYRVEPRAEQVATDGGIGPVCTVDGCDTPVHGLDDGREAHDREGVACSACLTYHERHGHWPDADPDICVECRLDDGAVRHDCASFSGDAVIVTPGEECPVCDMPVDEAGEVIR